MKKGNNFRQLRELLSQDEEGLTSYVYPLLEFGDVWWIPDERTKFGKRESHPWVVVQGYSERSSTVSICPRTTSHTSTSSGLAMPANVLDDLNKPGFILYNHRQPFPVDDFRHFDYIGRLPDEWQEKLRACLLANRRKRAT